MHELGMVLSGGGVKGAAHIGVLKALEEHNIRPTCVSGTSAGAIAAAFYACGYSSDEIFEVLTTTNFMKFKALSWSKAGMLDPNIFLDFLNSYFKDKTFESLAIELHVATTDIVSGKLKVFNTGPLLKPLLASSAFPFLFAPVSIGDSLYSDGGIINNFPVKTVVEASKKVLGVYVSPLRKIVKNQIKTSMDVADRAYRISNRYSSLNKLNDCTWVIHPPELEKYGTFTLSKIREIYELGYTYGTEVAQWIEQEMES